MSLLSHFAIEINQDQKEQMKFLLLSLEDDEQYFLFEGYVGNSYVILLKK